MKFNKLKDLIWSLLDSGDKLMTHKLQSKQNCFQMQKTTVLFLYNL